MELTLIKQTHQKNVYFNNVGYKFQQHFCSKCRDASVIAYELKKIAILNVKGVDYRCIIRSISKSKAVSILNNSMLED